VEFLVENSKNMALNDKRTINGWAIYDWANSAYFLVISTAIFPAYFIARTSEKIHIFDYEITNSSLYSYAVSLSYLIIVVLSPVLSGIADYGGKRMFFLKFFTYLGSISCIFLSFFTGDVDLWLGTSAFMLATIGAAGGLVFYNAYLPEIVTEDRFDKVSAKGYAYGYIGSVILLIAILFISLKPLLFGIPENTTIPYRLGFAMVGIWWIGFAQITFRRLPKGNDEGFSKKMIMKGFAEIYGVFNKLKKNSNLIKFLLAVFFYSAGVQTVIYLATVFAKEELKFGTDELIIIILILQIVAIIGAYIFAYISDKIGNKSGLIIMVVIWLLLSVSAYFVQNKLQFYFLAAMVGMVLGGIQSQSRSSYSKIIDSEKKDLTSYFSFYDIVLKLSIVIGTFAFGIVNEITGNLRSSVLSLAFFFLIGLILLYMTSFKQAEEDLQS
jgi:UMF1 family MFS transporter